MKNKYKLLTLKDAIETLVTYNVEHCRFPHNYLSDVFEDIPDIRGLAMDDKKLILLDREQGTEEMRETIIHELIHTKHFRLGDLRGIKTIENHVMRETKLTYDKLYKK